MADPFDRVGSVGDAEFRLAGWLPFDEAYQRRYVPVEPESRTVPGARDEKIAPQVDVAQWHMDDWSGGEGDRRWSESAHRYYESAGLHPASDGSGLIAGHPVSTTQKSGAAMTDGRLLFVVGGNLYSGDLGNDLVKWNGSTWVDDENIGAFIVSGLASGADDDYWFVGWSGGSLRRFQLTTNTDLAWESGYGHTASVVSFGGGVYVLDGNDLYLIDQSSATSQTKVADVAGSYQSLSQSSPVRDNRLFVSDKGPMWLATFPDGTTQIWEYNVALDTAYAVGTLPPNSVPYSLTFAAGIYFATFRQAEDSDDTGDAYLYYQRGGLLGVAGPLRSTASSTATQAPLIAGLSGDRILMVYTGNVWAYDLSDGGLSMVAQGLSSGNVAAPDQAVVFGDSVFVAGASDGTDVQVVERVDLSTYSTTAGTLDTGRFDFGYLGLPKTLTKVTVGLDSALVSGQKILVSYSVDGGSFHAIGADTDMGTGETRHMWMVSDSTHGTVTGQDFELRVTVTATASASPKVVSLTAEAIGNDDRIEWLLRPDVGWSSVQHPDATLAAFVKLKTDRKVVSFSDPWLVASTDSADTFDVVVREAYLPATDGGEVAAVVRLWAVGTLDSIANADGVS